jgi:hypothetical protein
LESPLLLPLLIVATPVLVASFDDPAGDVAYAPPTDDTFTDGDFDLRKFAVYADGDDVVFEVTLGAPFRRPEISQRTNTAEIQLWNNIYLQNIDIYVDTDPASTEGFTACIPGRRVAFEEGRTWKAAVVLTPQPGPARGVTSDAMDKSAAAHVLFPQDLVTSGRTVIARVRSAVFGGPPLPQWAYSVQVSGAQWERSFTVTDRLRGTREPNAFTMPVLPISELWAFGGAPEGRLHPRVVDVLLPPGMDQKTVLSSFSDDGFARIPFVSAVAAPRVLQAAPPQKKPASAGPELAVAYVAGNMVSLSGAGVEAVKPMQFGSVLDDKGEVVARVVVVQVLEGGAVASPVENGDRIRRGAHVRIEAAK